MTDLASELTILEEHYAQVESGLADRKAAQQAELQALADEFNAENVAAAREMVLTEGKIDYVKSKLRQADEVKRYQGTSRTTVSSAEQSSDVSLLDRIHRKQEEDAEQSSDSPLRDHFRNVQRDLQRQVHDPAPVVPD